MDEALLAYESRSLVVVLRILLLMRDALTKPGVWAALLVLLRRLHIRRGSH